MQEGIYNAPFSILGDELLSPLIVYNYNSYPVLNIYNTLVNTDINTQIVTMDSGCDINLDEKFTKLNLTANIMSIYNGSMDLESLMNSFTNKVYSEEIIHTILQLADQRLDHQVEAFNNIDTVESMHAFMTEYNIDHLEDITLRILRGTTNTNGLIPYQFIDDIIVLKQHINPTHLLLVKNKLDLVLPHIAKFSLDHRKIIQDAVGCVQLLTFASQFIPEKLKAYGSEGNNNIYLVNMYTEMFTARMNITDIIGKNRVARFKHNGYATIYINLKNVNENFYINLHKNLLNVNKQVNVYGNTCIFRYDNDVYIQHNVKEMFIQIFNNRLLFYVYNDSDQLEHYPFFCYSMTASLSINYDKYILFR